MKAAYPMVRSNTARRKEERREAAMARLANWRWQREWATGASRRSIQRPAMGTNDCNRVRGGKGYGAEGRRAA